VPYAERAERPRKLEPFGCGSLRVPRAKAFARGVHTELSTRFRVDEPKRANTGQCLFAGIADLDGDYVMTACESEQGAAPVPRAAEVRDQSDECPLACNRTGTP
jgi:hypothetical protein